MPFFTADIKVVLCKEMQRLCSAEFSCCFVVLISQVAIVHRQVISRFSFPFPSCISLFIISISMIVFIIFIQLCVKIWKE